MGDKPTVGDLQRRYQPVDPDAEQPPTGGEVAEGVSLRTILGALGLLLLLGLLGWAIAMTVLYAQASGKHCSADGPCDIKGAYSEGDGCLYSTKEQVEFYAETITTDDLSFGCGSFYFEEDWRYFPKNAPYHTYITDSADYANDPYLSVLAPLAAKGRALINDPRLSLAEKLPVQAWVAQLEFVANTSAINWAQAFEHDVNGYWWWPNAPECVGFVGGVLSSGAFIGESDYQAAVLNYMAKSVAAVNGTRQYLLDLLAADGLPRVIMGNVTEDYAPIWASIGDYTFLQSSYCGQGFSGAEQTQCDNLAQQLADQFAAFVDVWNGPWLQACFAYRPASAPSGTPLPGFAEAYGVAYYTYTGDNVSSLPELLEYVIRKYYEAVDASDALFDAPPFAQFVNFSNYVKVSRTDFTNPLLFDCWPTAETSENIRSYTQLMWDLAGEWGGYGIYANDNPIVNTFNSIGANAFYRVGTFDNDRSYWVVGGNAYVPISPVSNSVCANRTIAAPCTCLSQKLPAWIHEIVGHAFAIPTAGQMRCRALASAFSFTEGWAVYVETQLATLDSFREQYPFAYMNELATYRQTSLGGPVADAWNFLYQNISIDQCIQLNFDSGYGSLSQSRARCFRVFGGLAAQQFTYQRGNQLLTQQRALLESLTGDNFDDKLFHKIPIVFQRVLDAETFTGITPTLAAIMNGDPAARDMPYYDFLARYALQNTQQMARDFDPGNSCGRKPAVVSSAQRHGGKHAAVTAISNNLPQAEPLGRPTIPQ